MQTCHERCVIVGHSFVANDRIRFILSSEYGFHLELWKNYVIGDSCHYNCRYIWHVEYLRETREIIDIKKISPICIIF